MKYEKIYAFVLATGLSICLATPVSAAWKNQKNSGEPIDQGIHLQYTFDEMVQNSSKNALGKNPYYINGVARYADMLEQFYTAFGDGKIPNVEVLTMTQALEDAGISSAVRKKIQSCDMEQVMNLDEFLMMEEKLEGGIASSLLKGDDERR